MGEDVKARKIMSDIKVKCVLSNPFWATILVTKNFVENDQIPTMCTDGRKIMYNPKFVKSLSFQEAMGVVVHEAYHILLMHMIRLGNRNPMVANMAMDYAINPLVQKAGFTLPKSCLFDKKFDNMEWEAIYSILMKNIKEIEISMGNGEGEGKEGEGKTFTGNVGGVTAPKNEDGSALSESDTKKLEQEIKQAVQGALQAAKKIGNVPAGMERLVKELLEPVVNWKAVIQEMVVSNSRNDYSWVKPNRRYVQSGFMLPSLEKPEVGDIVVGIDTSGSMSERDLQEIASELQSILSTYNTKIFVVYWDTKAYPHEEFESGDDCVSLKMIGGGGTDIGSFFNYIYKHDFEPSMVLCFTDGYVGNTFPKKKPDCRTLFVLNQKNESFNAPFGEVITMVRDYQN
jgi:predicted metal-dependent peptidase